MKINFFRHYPIKKNKQLKRLLKKGKLQLVLNRKLDDNLILGIRLAVNCFNCKHSSDSDRESGALVVGRMTVACKKVGEKKTQYAELVTTKNQPPEPDLAMLIPFCSEFEEVD